MPLEDLVQISDVISVHMPYYSERFHIFDENIISKMKDGMLFVSISRAELIAFDALYRAIDNGKIKGAALDIAICDDICYSCKNLSNNLAPYSLECIQQTEYMDKFKQYQNVIITPNIAYTTQDMINSTLSQTMIYIQEALKGERQCRII